MTQTTLQDHWRASASIELAQWVAGPSTAGLMADWGADVVKVEGPDGDPAAPILQRPRYRQGAPEPGVRPGQPGQAERGASTCSTRMAGPASSSLLVGADVFLTNLRPQALERMGLDPGDGARAPPDRCGGGPDRLRLGRARAQHPGLRHRGLRSPDRDGPHEPAARRGPDQPAERHRRPHHRVGHLRRGPGRPGRAGSRPAGAAWSRPPCSRPGSTPCRSTCRPRPPWAASVR